MPHGWSAICILQSGSGGRETGVAVGCGWQAFVAYVNVACSTTSSATRRAARRLPRPLPRPRRQGTEPGQTMTGTPAILRSDSNCKMQGVWSGMVIGGTLMQTLILLWVAFRTDWDKEMEKARARLNKWEDKRQPLLEE
ncbi:hypothetical protein PVAP13_2NG513103 [Panicum virgatum]|uniref:Protein DETOXIFICATION n=1 Tax=Panicum virgatum TaxID=38727 RepID=A0A8T0VRB9_PANVG|nr:hypothetical protein PVAP13_2NG513103 [Panicum virgatum]